MQRASSALGFVNTKCSEPSISKDSTALSTPASPTPRPLFALLFLASHGMAGEGQSSCAAFQNSAESFESQRPWCGLGGCDYHLGGN